MKISKRSYGHFSDQVEETTSWIGNHLLGKRPAAADRFENERRQRVRSKRGGSEEDGRCGERG